VRCGISTFKLSTKTVKWEFLISVIIFQDVSDCSHCSIVLIGGRIEIMQRIWLIWRPITQGKINKDLKSHFATTEDVIKERLLLFDFNSSYFHGIFTVLAHDDKFSRSLRVSNLRISGRANTSFFVGSIFEVLVKLDLNFAVILGSSESIGISHDSGPHKSAFNSGLSALTLVDNLEATTTSVSSSNGEKKVVLGFLFQKKQ
jgi:hypothetical protein